MPIKSVEVKVQSRVPLIELGGGLPGPQGTSITGGTVNGSGHLILTLSTGGTIDAGYIIGPPGPIASITETGNGIIINNASPTSPVLSLDATLEAIANFATGANRVMVWSGTDTLTTFTVDTDGTLAANSDTRFATQKAVKDYSDAKINNAPNWTSPATDKAASESATSARIEARIAALVASAPGLLDTLDEIAAALGDDPNFSTTMLNALNGKQPLDANITSINSRVYTADQMIYWSADETTQVINTTAYGRSLLNAADAAALRTLATLATSDSPQFAGLNIGHASDTTVTRAAAGVLAVEGVQVLNAGGQQTVNDKDFVDSTTDIIGNADATKRSGFSNDLITAGQRRVMTIPDKGGVILTDPLAVTDVRATLDYRFTHIDGAPFDDFFQRVGIGGYAQNAKGVLVPTYDRQPVIDYYAGTALGTGFWAGYTNLAMYSEQFENAAWGKVNVTVTPDSSVGPDGNAIMDTLATSVAGGNIGFNAALSVGSTTIHSFSIFLKQGTAAVTQVYLTFFSGGTQNSTTATITWSTLDVVLGGTANNKAYQLDDVGGGIYRLTVVGSNSGGANTQIQIGVFPGSTAGSGTVIAWGAQLTATAFPVPYVPTTSVAVARAADSMVISGADFTDFFNPLEGTFYLDYVNLQPSSNVFNVTRNLGTIGPRMAMYISVSGLICFAVADDTNASVSDLSAGVVLSGRVASTYKLNDFKHTANGATVVTDVLGAIPTGLAALEIGRSPTGVGQPNGYLKRLIYWPKALSAAQLERMTA